MKSSNNDFQDFSDFRNTLKMFIQEKNYDKSNPLPQLLLKDDELIENLIKENSQLIINNYAEESQVFQNEMNFNITRICLLFKYLNLADEKIEEIERDKQLSYADSYTSKLKAVSDVVRNNKDLIYTHYIIQWLFEINKIKYSNFKINKSNVDLSNEAQKSSRTGEKFFIDLLHRKDNNKTVKESFFNNGQKIVTNYISIVEQIKVFLLQGKLSEAQVLAEELGLSNISYLLGLQLPFHDNSFDGQLNIDFDLLPLFCQTTSLKNYQKINSYDEKINDVVIGNFNWEISMQNKWKIKDNCENYLTPLLCFLSGNPNFSSLESKNRDHSKHDQLLYQLNTFYNTKVLEECSKLEFEEIHYTCPSVKDNFFNNKESYLNNILDILQHFKLNLDLDRETKDIFFYLEIFLINLHLIKANKKQRTAMDDLKNTFKDTTLNDFLNSYNKILLIISKIIEKCNDDFVNISNTSKNIKITINVEFTKLFGNSNNNIIANCENDYTEQSIYLTNEYLCAKYFFIFITVSYNFYSKTFQQIFNQMSGNFSNNSVFNTTSNNTINDLNSLVLIYDKIKNTYDNIILEYVNIIVSIIYINNENQINDNNIKSNLYENNYKGSKFHEIIILLGFCLNLSKVKLGLMKINRFIIPELYDEFSREIDLIFPAITNELRYELINQDLNCEEDLESGRIDINKIPFEKCLYRERKDISVADKEMLDKYFSILTFNSDQDDSIKKQMLNLLIKVCVIFINSNKYIESEIIVNHYSELIMKLIKDVKIDDSFLVKDNQVYLDNDENQNIAHSLYIISIINSTFFNFKQAYSIISNNIIFNYQQTETFKNSFTLFFRTIHFFLMNENIHSYIRNSLSSNQYNEFMEVIGFLSYQIIKIESEIILGINEENKSMTDVLLDIFVTLTGFTTINFSDYSSANFLESNYKVISLVSYDLRTKLIECIFNIIHKDRLVMKSMLNNKTKEHLKSEINEFVYQDY